MSFPEKFLDLFKPETIAYLYLATIMPDGSPQVTPVWFDTEGEYIRINTNEGRTKDRNMRARKQVAFLITDPQDPFGRYIQIRGTVVEVTEEGAKAHIDKLAKKYTGVDSYKLRSADEVRVIYKIAIDRAQTMG